MEPPPLFRAPPRISPPFSFAPSPSTHRYPLPFRPPRAPQGFVPAPGHGPGFHSAMGPGLLASPNALGDIPPNFNPTGPSPPTSLPLVAPSVGFYPPPPPSFLWHTPPSGTQHPTVPRGFNTGPPAYHEVNQDDRFIAEWLRGVETNRKHQQEQGTTAMKVPEARHLLSRALHTLHSLRSCCGHLADLIQRGEGGREDWGAAIAQAERWKAELLGIRGVIEGDDNLDKLSKKVAGLRKKRAKRKERLRRRVAEHKEQQERSELRAEQWLEQRRQEKLKEETERSVQAAASGLLGEVKRKLNDIQHYIKLANALKELREHKREASRKRGDPPPVAEDEAFSSTLSSLLNLLTERAKLYEEEDHALRVMVKEEVEEKMAADSQKAKRSHKEQVAVLEGGEGEEEGESGSDPLQPFTDYYLQAERSVEALVAIRRSWDLYLSAEGTPLPPQPLQSPPPSSTQWEQYIQDD